MHFIFLRRLKFYLFFRVGKKRYNNSIFCLIYFALESHGIKVVHIFSDFLPLIVMFLTVSKQEFILVLHEPFATFDFQNDIIIFCKTGDGIRPCGLTVEFSVPNFIKDVNRISNFRV